MASVSVSEKGVFIEGREYVPRDTVLSDEAIGAGLFIGLGEWVL